MMLLKTFLHDYDLIYAKAGKIFNDNNLCQWECNEDGTFSCVVNRSNSQNKNHPFKETDGCCIPLCKEPDQFDDKLIKKKLHNPKKGCLIKSLKCKLHYCDYLRKSEDAAIKKAIEELDMLINEFRSKYDLLWTKIPYASPKNYWVKHFRNLYL